MIGFVNAKINLGLNITGKRKDGYHNLETVFYPVGLYNGTPLNPQPFNDILEIHLRDGSRGDEFSFSGNRIDCHIENNLVWKAANLFRQMGGTADRSIRLHLDKHLPDGAGLGGGSADATFTLTMLNQLSGSSFPIQDLAAMAKELGADCPFFLENRPVYATGIGDRMDPVNLNLDGYWAGIVKPDVYISTREAFADITPRKSDRSIPEIISLPIERWEEEGLKNDFEPHIFELHPVLSHIKETLREEGSLYAAMSGSGSSIFGIFPTSEIAEKAMKKFDCSTFVCRL